MDFPKKQQQSLIPRYLLQYLTSLEYHHTDPTAPWGGGGGGSYTAGDGIEISDEDVISIDDTVALKTDLSDYVTSTALATELLDYAELSDLATVATSGDYNDLLNKPTIPVVPTNVSAFTNDAGYITSSALSNYVTLNGTQTITGSKTFSGITTFSGSTNTVVFTGRNPIKLKAPSNETTGFTLFNSSNKEKGYLQYNSFQDGLYLGRWGSSAAAELGFLSESSTNRGYKVLVPNLTSTVAPANNVNYMTLSVNNTKADSSGNISLAIPDVSNYYTKTEVDNLIPTVPTNVSAFTNDAGYITSSDLTGYATETWVTNQGYSTFSGSYNDLTDKPTIPSVSGVTSYYDALYWSTIKINNTTANIPSPSNFVTITSNQDITGIKTFTGDKRIAFKQASSSNNNTLGFTAYKYNGIEYGNLQIASRNVGGVTSDYVTLGNYSTLTTKARVGFRLQPNSSNSSYNFIMPYGTSNQFENNGYATYQNTTIPCAFSNGQYVINADETGLVDLSGFITVPLIIEINGTTSGNISFTNGIDFYIILYKSSTYQTVSGVLGTITNPTQEEATMINMLTQGLHNVIVQYTDGNVDHTHNFVMTSCDVNARTIRLIDDSGVNEILLNFTDITTYIQP